MTDADYVEWLAGSRRVWLDRARQRQSYGEPYADEVTNARTIHREMRAWQRGDKPEATAPF
ncbi:hypothetical protein [Caudoviricetes sp.]|nr:hypothetical protein [Caudoviricetes sp.]